MFHVHLSPVSEDTEGVVSNLGGREEEIQRSSHIHDRADEGSKASSRPHLYGVH